MNSTTKAENEDSRNISSNPPEGFFEAFRHKAAEIQFGTCPDCFPTHITSLPTDVIVVRLNDGGLKRVIHDFGADREGESGVMISKFTVLRDMIEQYAPYLRGFKKERTKRQEKTDARRPLRNDEKNHPPDTDDAK